MINKSSNKTYQKQNRKLIPDVLRKAIMIKFYAQTSGGLQIADIYFVNSPQTIVKGILVSDQVTLGALPRSGVRCIVAIFDESNPKDMIMIATY